MLRQVDLLVWHHSSMYVGTVGWREYSGEWGAASHDSAVNMSSMCTPLACCAAAGPAAPCRPLRAMERRAPRSFMIHFA